MSGFDKLMNKFGAGVQSQDYTPATELESPPEKSTSIDAFLKRFGGFTESYFFYNGTVELRFNTKEHIYYLVAPLGNLEEQDGVTNTTHIINASEMLIPWAAKMTVAKLLRLIPTETVDGILRIKPLTFEEFTTIALEAKSAHKDKLEEAGDIGHQAHSWLEEYIKADIAGNKEKTASMLNSIGEEPVLYEDKN